MADKSEMFCQKLTIFFFYPLDVIYTYYIYYIWLHLNTNEIIREFNNIELVFWMWKMLHFIHFKIFYYIMYYIRQNLNHVKLILEYIGGVKPPI